MITAGHASGSAPHGFNTWCARNKERLQQPQ